ncbi:unannotated protein [freshwater metagenome]|uniref:Unannotated protein n=1 Tax=freshwater metagenome TaxID=449393 RepID=A0A6J7QPH8_9ZZZZ
MLVERLRRRVGVGVELCDRRESRVDFGLISVADEMHTRYGERTFGDGAGLVGAQHIDAREHLDGRQFLHEAALAGKAHDTHGKGNAGEQHQTFGHHAH